VRPITRVLPEDEEAYLTDILEAVSILPGYEVLDVGAGSGALTKIWNEGIGKR